MISTSLAVYFVSLVYIRSNCIDYSFKCGINGPCTSCKECYFNLRNECNDACPDTCKNCTTHGHCLKCMSSTVCERCDYGYYGDNCNFTCPTTCDHVEHDPQCVQVSGTCSGCKDGFRGDYCNTTCSEKCIKKRCYKRGHCTEGCLDGYEGPTCEQKIYNDRTTDTDIVVGTATAVSVAIGFAVIVLAVITIRRWKMKQLQKYQVAANIATYVNTLQTTSTDAVNICVINEQPDQSDYERLDERNVTINDEYDQLSQLINEVKHLSNTKFIRTKQRFSFGCLF